MSLRLVVFVVGPPASGKTTLARGLAKSWGVPLCSPSEWLHVAQKRPHDMLGSYLQSNNHKRVDVDNIVCDYVTQSAAFHLRTDGRLVVDGFPDTRYHMHMLPRILDNAPCIIVSLEGMNEMIAMSRSNARPNIIEHFRTYSLHNAFIGGSGVLTIDALNGPEDVLDDTLNKIGPKSGHIYLHDHHGHAYRIMHVSPIQAARIQRQCQNLCDPNRKFPGAHPVSLQLKHLKQLEEHSYFVSHKVDGERHIVLISEGQTSLIKRDGRVWRLPFNSKLMPWKTTVLDVELVEFEGKEMPGYRCIILDCMYARGVRVMEQPLVVRLAHGRLIIPIMNAMFQQGCELQVYAHRADFRSFVKAIPPAYYEKVDGLVFTPAMLPYRCQRDNGFYKFKDSSHNTVDLLFRAGKMYAINDQHTSEVCYGTPTNMITGIKDGTIVECLMKGKEEWEMVRIRRDKSSPNSVYVVNRIIESLKEDIRVEDLMKLKGVL